MKAKHIETIVMNAAVAAMLSFVFPFFNGTSIYAYFIYVIIILCLFDYVKNYILQNPKSEDEY